MKRGFLDLSFVAAVIFFPTVLAPANQQGDKAAYQTELQKLQRDDPKKYEGLKATITLGVQLLLARLGYGVGPFGGKLEENSQTALRNYQKNRGIPEDGDPLSFETMEQVRVDSETMDYRPIGLPFFHFSDHFWDSGFVSAEGTWTIPNEKIAWPEQTAKIQCSKDSGTCMEATAIISRGGDSPRVSVDIETYEIERWDQHEIVTKPRQSGSDCTRYIRRFNRLQKSVTGIRSTISNEGICKGVEAGEKYLVLTDGHKVYWDLLQENNAKRWKLMLISPGLLERIEANEKTKPE